MNRRDRTEQHTPHQAVRAECRSCLSIPKGGSGYDCLDPSCPLYPAQPWRGRDLPKSLQPPNDSPPDEAEKATRILREVTRRRATRRMIRAKCRDCLPERTGQPDCTIVDCALFGLTPFQPGGQPKQTRSAKQQAAAKASGLANLRRGVPEPEPRRQGAHKDLAPHVGV